LAAAVRDAFDQINAAVRQVSRAGERGPLALSCEPTLLMRWLIPRLPSLAARTPTVNLLLSAGGGQVYFARDGIDVAIRRDDFTLPEGVTRTHLFDERIGPVCRPDIAERLTDVSRPWDWPLLHTRTRPQAWPDWRRHARVSFRAGAEQTFEHFYLALQAAVAGLGVAIGPYALVHDDLEQGQLVAPFGFVPDGTGYHLLSVRPPDQDDRIVVLLDWLRGQIALLGDTADA
jgi:DNA-binding transcriptional LysR family regulator